jgi:hypothetical protein
MNREVLPSAVDGEVQRVSAVYTRQLARCALSLLLAAACSDSAAPATGTAGARGGDASVVEPQGAAGQAQGNAGAGGTAGGSAGTVADPPDAGGVPDGGADASPPRPTLIGDVTFSVPSQTFRDHLEVSMTTTVAGAEIRYTTDGTLPSASASLYSGTPLAIAQTTQLRAQAFTGGAPSGLVSTAIYIARTFDFTSDLPIVIVDGYGGGRSTSKDFYLDAAVMAFEPALGSASLSNLPDVATRAGYRLRGQSSARFPQTPYRLELWDNADEDADYPMLGMPAQSDWALIAPYYDRSLIRNPFVYTLGRELGLEVPRVVHAEVFVNYEDRPLAESDYQGVYWFTETIKNASARTNLKQLRPRDTALPAISGGYIMKFDQAAAEEPKLMCTGSAPLSSGFGRPTGGTGGTCWVDLEVVDPDPLVPEQEAWLTEYVQAFHDALHATPIGDYAAYIDVGSFVDYLIVNELTRNVDAYTRSAYFHKDRDGKLKGGPLWDYNFSLAVGGQNTVDPEGGFQYDGSRNVNNWYPKLTGDPAFMAQVRARWQELRQGVFSDAALDARVTALAEPLAQAAARDYARWPVAEVYRNPGIVRGPTLAGWEEQLQALRDFLARRAAWIDAQYR